MKHSSCNTCLGTCIQLKPRPCQDSKLLQQPWAAVHVGYGGWALPGGCRAAEQQQGRGVASVPCWRVTVLPRLEDMGPGASVGLGWAEPGCPRQQ